MRKLPILYLFAIVFAGVIVFSAFFAPIFPLQNDSVSCNTQSLSLIPVAHAQAQTNPTISSFTTSATSVKKGEKVTLTWATQNTEKVLLGGFDQTFPASGSIEVTMNTSKIFVLYAFNQNCYRQRLLFVDAFDENANPYTQPTLLAAGIVALEATGTIVATVASPVNVASWNVWFAFGAFLDRLRKKKPWGVVYSSINKRPISRAIIRLHDATDNALIETTVTDAQGVFRLNPKQGTYYMKVTRRNYNFPSRLVVGPTDGAYANVYKGETLVVQYDGQALMLAIPMDDVELPYWQKAFRSFMTNLEASLRWVSDILLIVGLATSIAFAIRYRSALAFGILALYVLIFSIKFVFALITPKQYGIVKDQKGRAVANLEVGLYETEFNTLVARTFTDARGQYNFIVPFQKYNIRTIDPRYSITGKTVTSLGQEIMLPKNKGENILFVNQDILVTG
jgi:hypothetical protein